MDISKELLDLKESIENVLIKATKAIQMKPDLYFEEDYVLIPEKTERLANVYLELNEEKINTYAIRQLYSKPYNSKNLSVKVMMLSLVQSDIELLNTDLNKLSDKEGMIL